MRMPESRDDRGEDGVRRANTGRRGLVMRGSRETLRDP